MKSKTAEEIKEQARLFAESKMIDNWDRKDHIMIGIFYQHFVEYIITKFQHPVPALGDELVYWRQRCLAAEFFIKESPCDPDITNSQIEAHSKWQDLNKNMPDFTAHPVPDEAPKEWEEQAIKDYENGYESETSAIDKFVFADEAGEVYVKCSDCKGEIKNSICFCNRDDLSPAPPSGEDAGKGWISVEDRLPTEKDADENGKVLVYRNTNEGQKGLSKSIFDYFMVKNCDSDTVWQPLPPKP